MVASHERAQSVVAFGGGHGLSASLHALRLLVADLVVDDLTAVVTIADNGGSSGRLRGEFGVLPPGDLRMALAALCGDHPWGDTWARVLQHRFAGEGEMNGHVIGNLLIVGLWEQLGDSVAALDWVGKLLGTTGRVLPMALTPLDITAQIRGLDPERPEVARTVRGQVEVATSDGEIVSIALDPPDPEPCPEALAAVAAADWVVLGPGSWFTSVMPHLMVPEVRSALEHTDARIVVVLNLVDEAGETSGFDPIDHLAALLEHAPDLRIHTVLADAGSVGDAADELRSAVASAGAELHLDDVAADDGSPRHDPARLAAAYTRIMTGA
ncbi:gluconeogenesis factor YvcK family protein [Nocardioides sp. URHA0020]|uniref:gluconeogenesis factor YvcK family protein n=1 Tax=Nocardioides sp. URHA0020 TaxID=1380392 RepID=UPI0018CC1BA2|nr:uridine diphosphate-N-acetylglucosamine-binding protein YvcK [Nocardioides sp. URHA0020]